MQNQGFWVTTYYYRDASQISGIVLKKMWALDLICADVNVENLEAETSHGNPWEFMGAMMKISTLGMLGDPVYTSTTCHACH